MPPTFLYMRKKFWNVIVASVWFSLRTGIPSFASTAWCRPSGPAPPRHHPAGELVDDHHLGAAVLALAHDVVDVATLQRVRGERLTHRVQHRHHVRVVEVVDAQQLLDLVHALFGERRAVRLLVDPVVAGLLDLLGDLALLALDQLRHDPVDERVELDVLLRRARR
jgi:hypothetical protein